MTRCGAKICCSRLQKAAAQRGHCRRQPRVHCCAVVRHGGSVPASLALGNDALHSRTRAQAKANAARIVDGGGKAAQRRRIGRRAQQAVGREEEQRLGAQGEVELRPRRHLASQRSIRRPSSGPTWLPYVTRQHCWLHASSHADIVADDAQARETA